MNRRRLGMATLAVAFSAAFPTPALAADGRLEGQVVDSALGLQVDGICVTATHEDGAVFSAETSSGGFQFLEIPLRTYTIEFPVAASPMAATRHSTPLLR